MSKSLRDSAVNHFKEVLKLIQKDQARAPLRELEQTEEVAKLLLKDPDNEFFQTNIKMNFIDVFKFGYFLQSIGRFSQAQNFYELSFLISQNLLQTDPENVSYQSDVAMTLNNLGNLLSDMGRIEEAKQKYENALEMRENLLQTDPENVSYQSYVAMTLNNLGNLLKNMGRIEEAKQRYEKTLEIFTEPLQYLTIGKKSHSIIKLIELNYKLAIEEKQSFDQMRYLKKIYKLCKKHRDFFDKYELRNERELVTEAGLNAYIEFLMKRMKLEKGFEKRAENYGMALDAVKEMEEIEKDEAVSKLYISAACYLEGRKYINEALASGKNELGLVSKAVEKFKDARNNYKKADVCYNVYSGLLNVLEYVERDEEVEGTELEKLVDEAIKPFQDDVHLREIKASFESIPKIFQEKSRMTRKERQKEFEERVSLIESKALETLFGHVNRKIKDYFEKALNLNIIYEKWKLKVIFHDPEQIKGKLTIKAGKKTLFDRAHQKRKLKKA